MRLLLTGATGFLGRRVAVETLRRRHEAVCLVRNPERADQLLRFVPGELRAGVRFVTGDLTDPTSCRAMLDGCEVVVHIAARLNGSASLLFMSTVVGTRTLADAAVEQKVRRFVLVSSLGVYATHRLRPHSVLDESCELDPRPQLRDAYTYSKVEQERIAWEAAVRRDLPLVVIRPGVLFGPGRGVASGRLGLRIGPLLVRMGGARRMPYTYVDNCAGAIALAVDVPGIEGQAFNIVDDRLPTVRELVRAHSTSVGRTAAVVVPQWAVPAVVRACEWYCRRSNGQFPQVVTRYRSSAQWKPLRYSNQRAKRVLGWKPAVPFGEALEETMSSLRAHARAEGAS